MYIQKETELIDLGKTLGELLYAGSILVLSGQLGVGKTTFTKGLAQGLGISQMIKSPTYTIVREYEGRLRLYHLDVYRIGNDPDSIDLEDFLYGDGVTVIEWGELLDSSLLEDYIHVSIAFSNEGREVTFAAYGQQSQKVVERLVNES